MMRLQKPLHATFYLILLALAIWAGGFGYYAYTSLHYTPENPDQKTDAIVVLTGGDDRIETGLRLFDQGLSQYIFISGVHPDVKVREIRKLWTGPASLPACCILLGRTATSTIENAFETKAWLRVMRFKNIRLVTANYHMNRAILEFAHAMPELKILPQPVEQPNLKGHPARLWGLILSEYHKALFRAIWFQLEDWAHIKI